MWRYCCSSKCAKAHWNKSHCTVGLMVEHDPLSNSSTVQIINSFNDKSFCEVYAYVNTALSHVEDITNANSALKMLRGVTQPYASFVRNLWWDV